MENKNDVEIKTEEKANEIVEIDENEEITATQYDLPVSEPKKKGVKKSGGRSKLSRKAKITIIIILIVLLLIGIGLIVYFLLIKGHKGTEIEKPAEEVVIVEKDNYRFQNGKLVFKEDNNDIGEYTCKNNNDVLCYVAYYSNEDDFDVTEKVYETGIKIQDRSDIFKKNYVFIYDNEDKEDGTITLYDIKESKVLGEYKLVKELKSDRAIVKDLEDNYQILFFGDELSKLVDKNYDYIGYISDSDKIVVASNNNYQLFELTGEESSKEVPGLIKNFDDNNISVEINNSEFIYNYDGERILEKEFDYIRFTNSYIIGAVGKKLYVYDSDGSPMIIDGIRISSNKYNTRLIYDKDLKQVGREFAFDAFVTGSNMRIEYGEDYQVINLYEGSFSKSLKYANYIQGKLYFYSDEDKTNLIGTYTCKNANVVTGDTSSLDNCYIANESAILQPVDQVESLIPIYNKRFVFIKDVDSTKRGNIVLYDLANSKEKASYTKVDAGYHKGGTDIEFVETAGTLVAAQNTSNSYGVINIGSSDVTSIIKFRDDSDKDDIKNNVSIKYLDNNLLVKRSDGTYHLYDTKGKYLTKGLTTSNEIVKLYDKYVMVKSGSHYLLYGLDGTIISLEYKYIAMTDLVYVAINDSNKLEAYKYTDKSRNLIVDDISVDNNSVSASIRGSILTISYTKGGESLYQEINIDNPEGDNNG